MFRLGGGGVIIAKKYNIILVLVGIITSILYLFPHLHINMKVCKFSIKYTHYIYFSLVGDVN